MSGDFLRSMNHYRGAYGRSVSARVRFVAGIVEGDVLRRPVCRRGRDVPVPRFEPACLSHVNRLSDAAAGREKNLVTAAGRGCADGVEPWRIRGGRSRGTAG